MTETDIEESSLVNKFEEFINKINPREEEKIKNSLLERVCLHLSLEQNKF